jgi:hypothetical protein
VEGEAAVEVAGNSRFLVALLLEMTSFYEWAPLLEMTKCFFKESE